MPPPQSRKGAASFEKEPSFLMSFTTVHKMSPEKQEVTVRSTVMYQKTAGVLPLWVDAEIINLLQLVSAVFCF